MASSTWVHNLVEYSLQISWSLQLKKKKKENVKEDTFKVFLLPIAFFVF